ncbi:membrane protein of ER body-like protein [Tanacetum coccineum]
MLLFCCRPILRVLQRRQRITGLEALGNCEDAARTVGFWERMQLDDVEKGTRALLLMKETKAKIGEKARFILNLRGVMILELFDVVCLLGSSINLVYVSKRFLMAELPRIDELRRATSSLDWENMFMLYCHRAIVEDERLAWDINGLCAGLTTQIKEMSSFIGELDVLADEYVLDKMAKFLKETQSKDIDKLMKLQILGGEFKLRIGEKRNFVEKDGKMNKWLGQETLFLEILKSIVYGGLMEVIASLSVVASAAASDAATLKDVTLQFRRDYVGKRSAGEDYRLAREINKVAMEVNGVVMAKDQFIEELDSLGTRHVPLKMAEFLREIQRSDKETVAKLQILVREMELNARKKDPFVQKLDCLIPY